MTKLIGLFADQKKAEEAVEALAAANLDDVDFETILQWDERHENEAAVAPAGFSGTPVAVGHLPSWDLDGEEEEYFKRAVKRGGVLVVVNVDDEEHTAQVRHILDMNSEKVAAS